jgi:hypothetical protein
MGGCGLDASGSGSERWRALVIMVINPWDSIKGG